MTRVTESTADAAAALATGQVAALPTETVYGLGASIEQPEAIARVFEIKGRPTDHPLILHVTPDADLSRWASGVPTTAAALLEAFWPGPLTLVLAANERVPASVTGGQSTVALRAPSNQKFLEVLRQLGELTGTPPAIAAPSANLFGQVSPTTASHVVDGLGSRLRVGDVILDGGPSLVGIESTIVLCRENDVLVLRPGGITAEELSRVVTVGTASDEPAEDAPESPRVSGSLESHYSPAARVLIVESVDEIQSITATQKVDLESLGVIALASKRFDLALGLPHVTELARPVDLEAYAAELYAALRQADGLGLQTVVAVLPPNTGVGVAIRDRLQRAAASL